MIDDNVEIHLGFLKDTGIAFWIKDQLIEKEEINLALSDSARHIVLADHPEMMVPSYQYVQCSIPMRSLVSSACAGIEGRQVESLTLRRSSQQAKPTAKEVFKKNSLSQVYDNVLPSDIDEVLDSLLALGNVHIMGHPTIKLGDRTVVAKTIMYGNNEKMLAAARKCIEDGLQVFLYSYYSKHENVPDPVNIRWWRWAAAPMD